MLTPLGASDRTKITLPARRARGGRRARSRTAYALGAPLPRAGTDVGRARSVGVDVLTHQVQITVAVEIVDRKRNVVLWDSNGVVGRGEYRISDQRDTDAREQALNHILQLIIDGAQSQW